jgi:uncharacterized protein (DUF1330 family)
MSKGYWLAQIEVTDPQGYKDYVAANQAAFRKYGARYVIRAGRHEALEGTCRSRLVVIEFPDYETALACYRSPEYQHAFTLRQGRALCHEHRRSTRRCATVREMKEGPSSSIIRC